MRTRKKRMMALDKKIIQICNANQWLDEQRNILGKRRDDNLKFIKEGLKIKYIDEAKRAFGVYRS